MGLCLGPELQDVHDMLDFRFTNQSQCAGSSVVQHICHVGNGAVLDDTHEDFGKGKWVFVGFEFKDVFWQQDSVDKGCFKLHGKSGIDGLLDGFVINRECTFTQVLVVVVDM